MASYFFWSQFDSGGYVAKGCCVFSLSVSFSIAVAQSFPVEHCEEGKGPGPFSLRFGFSLLIDR